MTSTARSTGSTFYPTHSQAEQNSSLGKISTCRWPSLKKINYFYFNHALKRVLEATGGNQQSLAEKIAQTPAVDKFLLEQMDRCQGKDQLDIVMLPQPETPPSPAR